MLPLNVIRKYYPDLSDGHLKKIQVFVYELCCGLMQYFYGNNWEKDIIPDLRKILTNQSPSCRLACQINVLLPQ